MSAQNQKEYRKSDDSPWALVDWSDATVMLTVASETIDWALTPYEKQKKLEGR